MKILHKKSSFCSSYSGFVNFIANVNEQRTVNIAPHSISIINGFRKQF